MIGAGLWLYDRRNQLIGYMSRLFGKGTKAGAELFGRYQAVHIGSWSTEAYVLLQVRRLAQAWLVLTGASGLGLLLAVTIHSPLYNADGAQSLQRPEAWEESKTYHLLAEADGVTEEIDVTVPGQAVGGITSILEAEAAALPQKILGENQSLEAVTTDLELPGKLDGGIQVSWECSLPEFISPSGTVYNQELEEEGIVVELIATLSYGDIALVTVIPVQIYPVVKNSEYYMSALGELLEAGGQVNREDAYMQLPDEIEGMAVHFDSQKDVRPWYILSAGAVLAVCIVFLHRQQIEDAYKQRNMQLQVEYSKIVSELAMLLHCGLPVRVCWQRMTAAYEQEKQADSTRFSYALEEMELTYRQMAAGVPEAGAYLTFGNRCDLYEYRRLGMLLEQTVRQGSSGLMGLLENEAVWATEQRKNLARKRGEEAGTKMMLPMFMMFGVVVAVIMVPALMSF